MAKTIEDRLGESHERERKIARKQAIISNGTSFSTAASLTGMLLFYTNLVADDGDWRKAIFYATIGTAFTLPAYLNYKKYKSEYKSPPF